MVHKFYQIQILQTIYIYIYIYILFFYDVLFVILSCRQDLELVLNLC